MSAQPEQDGHNDLKGMMRAAICFPDPILLMAINPKNGGIIVQDVDATICGCFYWYENAQGEIIVPLYDCQSNTLLEDTESYKYALKFKPILQTLVDEYKMQAAEYVRRSSDLVLQVIREAIIVLCDLFKPSIENLSPEAVTNEMHQKEFLRIGYIRDGKKTTFEIRRSFFETIYREVIKKIGKYPLEPEPTYEINEGDFLGEFVDLQFNDITLVSGLKEAVYKIMNVHKNTIKMFVEKNNQSANEICHCYEHLLDIKEKLFLEL